MPKSKKVAYTVIRDEGDDIGIYRLLRDLVYGHHSHLRDARIMLAWHTGWKPDKDGRLTLGKCKRASDLDRQLADFDFVILLNRQFWTDPNVTDDQRRALLDHELCHADIALDKDTGEPVEDETGRIVYRLRKHDLEEFSAIVERHGCYKRDLEQFASALFRSPQRKLFEAKLRKDAPGLKKEQPFKDEDAPTPARVQ